MLLHLKQTLHIADFWITFSHHMFPAAYQEFLSFNKSPPSLVIFLDIFSIHERI